MAVDKFLAIWISWFACLLFFFKISEKINHLHYSKKSI